MPFHGLEEVEFGLFGSAVDEVGERITAITRGGSKVCLRVISRFE